MYTVRLFIHGDLELDEDKGDLYGFLKISQSAWKIIRFQYF